MGRVKFGISDAFCIFFQDRDEENIAGYFSYRATRFSTKISRTKALLVIVLKIENMIQWFGLAS